MLLINCEIELDLTRSKICIISEILRTPEVAADPNPNPPVEEVDATRTKGATFKINSTKIYVRVVNLSLDGNIKFLENIKQRFKRTVCWSIYRSEIKTQLKNNNLDYMIDLIYRNINR